MSIIYDALKKVEKSINKNNQPKVSVEQIPPRARSNKPNPILVYTLIIFAGIFIWRVFFVHSPKKAPIPQPEVKEPVAIPQSPPQVATKEAKEPQEPLVATEESEPTFILNGVFFEGNKQGYALINNRIVREQDKISGAIVMQISLDGVKLDLNGRIIELANPPR